MPAQTQVWRLNGATLWLQLHLQLFTFSKNNELAFSLYFSDPFAAVFGNESFGGGFADFSALAKVLKWWMTWHIFTHTLVFSETDSIKRSGQNYFLSLLVGEIVLLSPVLLKMGVSTVCNISCLKVGADRPVGQAPCCLCPWVVPHVCALCPSLILCITSVFKHFFVHM